MKQRDVASGLFFLLFALLGIEEAVKLPVGDWQRPAPGFFPLALSLLLGTLAVILLLAALIQANKGSVPSAFFASSAGKRRVLLTVMALILFYLFLETIGFLLASFLFVCFLLAVVSPQRWVVALGTSLLSSLTLHLVLALLLKLPLPKGIFGF